MASKSSLRFRQTVAIYQEIHGEKFLFTMSFFGKEYREALKYCGSHSSGKVDKAQKTGLTPFEPAPGTAAFTQSRLIFVCGKLYHQDIDPERFFDMEINSLYPEKDYHRMYIGEIKKTLIRE